MLRRGLKRNLLFLLSYCADVYTDLSVKSFYRSFYVPGGYKSETLTQYLSKMAKVGEIEKKIIKGRAILSITTKGEKLLDDIIPLQKLKEKKWDGWWRIVIFDIEEKNKYLRDRVRVKLLSLGFGKWQESVYISPHPLAEEMNEYFEEKNLYPRCICLEARETGEKDNELFAKNIFGLNRLAADYNNLRTVITDTIQLLKDKKLNKSKGMERLRNLLEKYEFILQQDPFLPDELWPDSKVREEAKTSLSLLAQIIAKII